MHHVLVALQYEKASNYSILIFVFHSLDVPSLRCSGPSPRSPHLHVPASGTSRQTFYTSKIRKYRFPRKRECSSPEPPEQVQSEAVLRFAPMTRVGDGLFGINLQQSTSAADTEKQQWRSVPSSLTPKPLLEGWQRTKNSFSVSLIPDRKHTKKGFLRRMLWVPNKTTQNEKKGKRLSLNGISVINRYLF